MIYTVVLNSTSKVVGSTTTNALFNFDWSYLPDNEKYKMSYTFCSDAIAMTTLATIPCLYVQLSQSNIYTNSITTGATTTNMIGVLSPFNIGAVSFLYADTQINSPIYLNHKPVNNVIKVDILTNASPPVNWADSSAVAVQNYILTLTFETI